MDFRDVELNSPLMGQLELRVGKLHNATGVGKTTKPIRPGGRTQDRGEGSIDASSSASYNDMMIVIASNSERLIQTENILNSNKHLAVPRNAGVTQIGSTRYA